jgi:predicted dehydrogenase
MERTRVGLIGTGYWARTIHGASVVQHPDADLVGVWGRDAQKTSDAAAELGTRAFDDVEDLLRAVDALTFAVPPDVQAPLAIRAAEAGRHLLLEKPLATSVADARRVEVAVRDARVGSVVFFTRRFIPETKVWLEQLANQGGWQSGRAEFASNIYVDGGPFADSPWRRVKGALWDIGPHALALLLPVLGPVTAVLAGAGRGDQVHLVLQHADGSSSTASLSLTAPAAARGSTLYFDGEHGRASLPARTLSDADIVAAHRRAFDQLRVAIEQPGVGNDCDVRFGARVVEILAAAEQALTTGCTVQIVPS